MIHGHGAGLGALVAIAGAAAGHLIPVATPDALSVAPRVVARDCSVTLHAWGTYRLTVATGGPVPVVDFRKASGPRFDPIRHVGNLADCDRSMGELTIHRSRNASPLLYHVSNELYTLARVEWQSSQRPHLEYAYRDFGNLASAVSRNMLLMGFRQTIAAIASDLVSRYGNPVVYLGGRLSDEGAKWVAQTAVKLMIEGYVEGRDPGLIIDGLLTRMVDHLKGHAETLAGNVGGDQLKEALKPVLGRLADDVKAQLVEAQPDAQTVDVTAADDGSGCTHYLQITWSFKGGTYRAFLTIRCGNPSSDWIGGVNIAGATVEPGEAGNVTAQALSQLGVPMPLATATSSGIAPVQAAGAGEPAAAGLPGNTASFPFTAATPRADLVYDVQVNLLTTDLVGRLSGLGRGRITVKNVAPTVPDRAPEEIAAAPGDWLELSPASIVVEDRNADAGNAGEVQARSLRLRHPAGLVTTPLFDAPGNPRQAGPHQAATGRYTFRFDRRGRVADPHPHGTWPLTVEVADDDGETATTTIGLSVRDVAPTVEFVRVTPGFVHREPGGMISIELRVRDRNGADDVTGARVDATAAGGGVYAPGAGLVETGRGDDWIEFRTASVFRSTREVGEHAIPVEATDETNTGTGRGTLHVGNLAPVIGGYGLILDADSIPSADRPEAFILVPPDGLCPGDHFRAGLIARDPENDSLKVTATFQQTGASTSLPHTSDRVWAGDLVAPDAPGTYTLELTVTEDPSDKSATVTMTVVVRDCGRQPADDPRVALADPATPADVAAAPADPAGQKEFAAIIGSGVVAPSGELPGSDIPPSGPAVALLDSIGLVLSGSGNPMAPPVETYILATGGSTGPVGRMFAINRSGVPIRLPRSVMVVEPVAITPDIQARVTDLLQRYIAAGGSPVTLDMYCLERLRLPPAGGTLLRIVAEADAAPFRRFSGILDAVDRVRDGIGLHPDSDPIEYFHAIRQWALWSAQEEFDADGFAEAFVETTRQTLEAGGQDWTAEVEQAVRGLIPNRWTDVRSVLREAGFSPR